MYCSVENLWSIYIFATIIFYIGFGFLLDYMEKKYHIIIINGIVFFLATIMGGIIIFIGIAWLDPNNLNNNDKTSLGVLLIFASLLFILAIFYISFIGWHDIYI